LAQKEVPLALFRFLSFRTRSAGRDQQTDAARLGAVASAVESQLTETERELSGLLTRMNEAYLSATSLMEASGDYADRSADDEAEIQAFETSANAARERIGRLEQQKILLEQIRTMLHQAMPPLSTGQ